VIYVLDASAMIAYLRNEPGAEMVEDALTAPGSQCVAHSINLCEVFYDFLRSAGETEAANAITDLSAAGITERNDFDRDFWMAAGTLKGTHHRISLADCCGLTLATRLDAQFLTTDHRELDSLASAGSYRITFIR
jgi:PIN domain nuclease of toxin-antitoxin system